MQVEKVAQATQLSLEEIKQIGSASGPCISILMPVFAGDQETQNPVRLRHAVEKVKEQLQARNVERGKCRELMEALKGITEDLHWAGRGLAIFCVSEFCRVYQTRRELSEAVVVGDHFYIRPLVPLLDAERVFYILTLSQKHVRLVKCTDTAFEDVPLPEKMPKSLLEDMATDQPDHDQDNMNTGGPSTGSMKGVMFTTNTDREDKNEYLRVFYKHVSDWLMDLVGHERAPVVIAGVEYEIADFRQANTYPYLVEDAVFGAPDGMKGSELHKRALNAIQSYFEKPLRAVLARFDDWNTERASSKLSEIVAAAFDGRVMELIVSENAEYRGRFDETTHEVKAHKQPNGEDEDLLNFALLQTILHAGEVFVVPANRVPNGAPAVATYRY